VSTLDPQPRLLVVPCRDFDRKKPLPRGDHFFGVIRFEKAGEKEKRREKWSAGGLFFTCGPLPPNSANRKLPGTDPHGVVSINFLHDDKNYSSMRQRDTETEKVRGRERVIERKRKSVRASSESESKSERQSAHARARTRESVRTRDTLSTSLARASRCFFSLSLSVSLLSACEKERKRERKSLRLSVERAQARKMSEMRVGRIPSGVH